MEAMTNEEQKRQMEVAWYSSLVDAWVNTRMERDKSILSLSSGAIGLLITLLIGFNAVSFCEVISYALSFVCFIVAIISVLIIFGRNAVYLKKIKSNDDSPDPLLAVLDVIVPISFGLGVLFSISVAITSVQRRHYTSTMEAISMSNEEGQDKENPREVIKNSLNDLSAMRPVTKSLNGLSSMKPAIGANEPLATTPLPTPTPDSAPSEEK